MQPHTNAHTRTMVRVAPMIIDHMGGIAAFVDALTITPSSDAETPAEFLRMYARGPEANAAMEAAHELVAAKTIPELKAALLKFANHIAEKCR